METRKLQGQPYDIPPPEPGRVIGFVSMFGFADGAGDHILRVEAVVCVPSERLIVRFKSWDLTGELADADPSDLVVPFCAAHNVEELQFGPELLSLAEASAGECQSCGGLSCRVPWTRDRALL